MTPLKSEATTGPKKKEGAFSPLPIAVWSDGYAVWSSTLASGAFFATEAMPLSRALADS